MKCNPKEFDALPEVISKEQLRVACHISKRTALYLLQSGLIPSETTGKKTRCYSIQKRDVVAYLKGRERDPAKYQPPENWYSNKTSSPKPYVIRHLPSGKATKRQLEDYYKQALSDYSDVVDVDAIMKFTGYNRRTVGGWCRKGRLKFIMSAPKYRIPKCFLIEYLCSDRYDQIIRKSKEHLNAIWEVYQLSHNGIPVAVGLE